MTGVRIHPTQPSKIIVEYPVRTVEHIITAAEYHLISTTLNERKISAVKFIRDQYDLDLYEAKQIVDTILESTR